MNSFNKYQLELDSDCVMQQAVQWTWSVFTQYCQLEGETERVIKAGYKSRRDIVLSRSFWESIENKEFDSSLIGKDLLEKEGDLLATAFYFLNCLWEREESRTRDHWDRSDFSHSIWSDNGLQRPVLQVNKVFDKLADQLNIKPEKRISSLFLSHDIDAVNSAWMEEGKAALKKGKIGVVLKSTANKLVGRSSWFNFDEIAEVERNHGYTSTFYWLAVQGTVKGAGKNADYDVRSEKFKDAIQELCEKGMHHGIHKSIAASTLKEELGMLPVEVNSNRYHYLKFHFPDLISEISASELKMDASLGYAEVIGYRNGYSLPFVPFDLGNNRPADFVEVPLCIMDATLSRYKKLKGEEALTEIELFISEHLENAVISILWHNTHFTDNKYEGYPEVYERVLEYARNKKLPSVNPQQIISDYYVFE